MTVLAQWYTETAKKLKNGHGSIDISATDGDDALRDAGECFDCGASLGRTTEDHVDDNVRLPGASTGALEVGALAKELPNL